VEPASNHLALRFFAVAGKMGNGLLRAEESEIIVKQERTKMATKIPATIPATKIPRG
jgi:hypothetical protein